MAGRIVPRLGRLMARRVGSSAPQQFGAASAVMRGGGHDDGTRNPPYQPLAQPSSKLFEEHELVWHDGVAPESALDMDAPHISTTEALKWWLGGLTFFATVLGLVALSDPPSKRPGAPREIPESTTKNALQDLRARKVAQGSNVIVR